MNAKDSEMNPDPKREAALFQAAAELTGNTRAKFLDDACQGKPALRARLEVLLAADAQTGGPLADTAPAAKATMKIEFVNIPDETVGQKIGRYKILEKVGEGGCGVVYVAEQTEPVRRRVALKVIKLGMDTKQVVARFEAERQALAMMDHPNIAKVLDAGSTEQGRPYFVMELVRGIRITDYCDQNNLATKDRLDLFIQVCHAIQHAHQKGIIHRDIKPSNILVTLHDGVPVPKVIDFGIAKATEGRLTEATVYTQLHQFIGTPAYMSPEQAEMSGLDIDTRSDIYALGVLLYELLTGSTPFDATELMSHGIDAMRKTIREQDPVRPSTKLGTLQGDELTTTAKRRSVESSKLAKLLRGDLDWIVMKCLEKDRTRRYDTANGLATELKRYLNEEPVSACPPSQVYRLQKAVRRNKIAFAAGGAIVTALLIGIVGTTFGLFRARQQRDVAEKATEAAKLARQAAETNAQLAATSERMAAASAADAKHQLTRLHVATGTQAKERGDPFTALLWYVRAWQGDADPTREAAHRMRLGAVLDGMPRLAGVCFHQAGVDDVDIDPAGQRLVTRTMDRENKRGNMAYIWDYAASKLATPPLVHAGPVRFAGFSPDGTLVLTASEDKTAVLWNAATGRKLRTLEHDAPVVDAAIAPDGKTIATAAGTKVTFWNPATGERTGAVIECPALICVLQFSRDGSRIFTVDRGGYARVWQSATGQAIGQPIAQRVPTEEKEAFYKQWPALSPDGERILTTIDEKGGMAQAHELTTGKLLWEVEARGFGQASWSQDGRQATFSQNTTIFVVDGRTGKQVHAYKHSRQAPWSALSPDGQTFATGMSAGSIYLWNTKSGEPLGPPLQCADFLRQLQFSPDGKRLIACSQDGTARVWELAPTSSTVPYAFDCGQAHLAFFQNGASASPDGRTQFHPDPAGGTLDRSNPKQSLRLEHPAPVTASRFSGDGRRLATFTGKAVRVWDAATGAPIGPAIPIDLEFELPPKLEFSGDGQRVAIIYSGHDTPMVPAIAKRPAAAIVWDAAGQRLFALPAKIESGQAVFGDKAGDGAVTDSTFSPDGKTIVAGVESSGEISAFEVDTGKRLYCARVFRGRFNKPVFHPDGRSVLIGASDQTVREFDVLTGATVGPALRHPYWPLSPAIDIQRREVATLAEQGRLRIWDAKTGDVLVIAAVGADSRAGCWFSRDGTAVQYMQANAWRQFPLPSCLGSQEAVRHASALLTGHFLDANDSLADVGPNEFIESRAGYRKAWMEWQGLTDAPQNQP